MLKPYSDKDSFSFHSVNVVSTVPFENIDCKIQNEDEYFVKSDFALAKLQNSDILRNLDQKLSHFKLPQRLELSKVHEVHYTFLCQKLTVLPVVYRL